MISYATMNQCSWWKWPVSWFNISMIWWYCKHHCHIEAYRTTVVIFLTLLMANFSRRWFPCPAHTYLYYMRAKRLLLPLPSCLLWNSFGLASSAWLLSAVEGIWTSPACWHLPEVSWHPESDPSGQLQPGATGSACCSRPQVMGKAPEWEHLVALQVLQALTSCSHPCGPHSCGVQEHTKQWAQRAEIPLEDLEEEQLPHCVFNFLCNPRKGLEELAPR